MSMPPSADLEQRCSVLRKELKVWEKQFAAQHNGKKASREDIRSDTTISQKYKEYNKLRESLSAQAGPQTPSRAPRKRKLTEDAEPAPKPPRADLFSTPLKRKRPNEAEFTDIPGSAENSASPQGPLMIGPTPQRDGIVLGLFDLLPAETPSRSNRKVLGEVVPNVAQTPSNRLSKLEDSDSIATPPRGEKTPLSAGKRFLLDQFVTPNKRKRGDPGTPSTLKALATPDFLRRGSVLDVIDEEEENAPRHAPWERKGLVRSLSSMIQSLKKQEEERLDEELDIMREMEMEAEGLPIPKKPKVAAPTVIPDSQPAMPLGPDQAPESDEEEEEDPNGRPKKVWKKRGQKRTTRRVIMRPTFIKPTPQAEPQESTDEELENVAETHTNTTKQDNDDNDDTSDYDDDAPTPKKRKTISTAAKVAQKGQPKKGDGEGVVKAVVRKVKESAHANYKRLKIRGQGGSGKGPKGRFGRRR